MAEEEAQGQVLCGGCEHGAVQSRDQRDRLLGPLVLTPETLRQETRGRDSLSILVLVAGETGTEPRQPLGIAMLHMQFQMFLKATFKNNNKNQAK